MKDKSLVRLLEIQHEQDCKCDKIRDAGLDVDDLRIDLLDVVLDELGVPSDNMTIIDDPEPFCRDWLATYQMDMSEQDNPDWQEYLDWVRSEMEGFADGMD